jgi:Rrf2 family protein
MSILNDTAEYAVRAALYIAQHGSRERPARVEDIATATGIPRNYLSKIMHTYVGDGVLASTTGPRGGFWLAIPPAKLPLIRLVEPFDPVSPRRTCILGRAECSDRKPCPAHTRWKGISEDVTAFFRKTTVGDLLNEPGSLI